MKQTSVDQGGFSVRVRFIRFLYALLAWSVVVCIMIQVFLAGLAVFVDPVNWRMHTTFVKFFELVPIVMFLLSFFGRMPRWMPWLTIALYIMIFSLYITAKAFTGVWPAALHPVIALLLFWGSFTLVRRSRRWLLYRD